MSNYPDGMTQAHWRHIDGDEDRGELVGYCTNCDAKIYEEDDRYYLAQVGLWVCEHCMENGLVRGR